MQWILAVLGFILGVGFSINAACIGALLGLTLGQAIELSGLRKRQESQDAQLKMLTRLARVEQSPLERQASAAPEPSPVVEAAKASVDLTWDVPAQMTSCEQAAEPSEPPAQLSAETILEELSQPIAHAVIEPLPALSENTAEPFEAITQAAPPPPSSSSSTAPAPPAAPDWFDVAKNWLLSGNIVLRVGLLLLFLGLAFLLRYVAGSMVVPISVRYLLVAGSGVALLALGAWLLAKRRDYALLLQGTGIGVIYLTTFAAMRLHPLLTSGQAFSLLVLVTLACVALALWQNALSLAVAAVLGGFAAPILASSGSGNHIALFSYFTLLNLGIFAIAWFKAWRLLNLVGFVGTFGIGLVWGLNAYQAKLFASTEPFLLLSFLLYLAIALLFSRRRLLEAGSLPAAYERMARVRWGVAQTDYIDTSLLFGLPLTGFGLQYGVIQHIEYGAAYSALALGLLYLVLARWLFSKGERLTLLTESCLALGVIFISLAIPLAFDARWSSAAWAVQGAGIYWLGMRQHRPFARMFAAMLQSLALFVFLYDLRPDYEPLLGGAAPLGALMLGASLLFVFYLQRQANPADLRRWEIHNQPLFAVLGLCLLYLIAPLCFGSVGTALCFAVAGLLTLLVGLYFALRSFLWTATAVQFVGGAIFLLDNSKVVLKGFLGTTLPWLLHSSFWLPLILALLGIFGALRLHQCAGEKRLPRALLKQLSRFLLGFALFFWVLASIIEVRRLVPEPIAQIHLLLGVAALSALLWTWLATRVRWVGLAFAALWLTPIAWFFLNNGWHNVYQPLMHYGWLVWPLLFAVHGWMLWRLERTGNLLGFEWMRLAHLLGFWLLLAVLSLELHFWLSDFASTWRLLGTALLPAAFLALLTSKYDLPWSGSRWEQTYRVVAALPLVLWLLGWFCWAGLTSNGSAAPLPYLPLVNPLELSMLLVLGVLFCWTRQALIQQNLPPIAQQPWLQAVFGLSLWMLLSMAVCRGMHQFIGVPFNTWALSHSMPVQAGLSLVWTVLALALMLAGHLRRLRLAWLVGAALIALVVAKLFLVELAASGTLERIVSFIGVGVLLLVVGYFAPLPPRKQE